MNRGKIQSAKLCFRFALAVGMALACASTNCALGQVGSGGVCVPDCPIGVPLRKVTLEDRLPIQLADIAEPIYGYPIGVQPGEMVRDLTFEECGVLAANASPLANQMERHRNWMAGMNRSSSALQQALSFQAAHERSRQSAMAQEAYLNLAEIYAQQPILEQSRATLDAAAAALEKFRDAGMEAIGDPGELDRQRIEIAERIADLRYEQARLNDGLEYLVGATIEPNAPIWTALQTMGCEEVQSEETAVARAMSQRGDLRALECLAHAPSLTEGVLAELAGASNPLLSSGLRLPGPARWWQCALKDQIECLQQVEESHRRDQLRELICTKREEVRLEVLEARSSLLRHLELLELKERRLNSLQQSIESAALAKDERPIDFESHFEQQAALLKLSSEIVHELFAIEIDAVRLRQSIGE